MVVALPLVSSPYCTTAKRLYTIPTGWEMPADKNNDGTTYLFGHYDDFSGDCTGKP